MSVLLALAFAAPDAHASSCLWSGKHIEKGTLTCYRAAGDTGSLLAEVDASEGATDVRLAPVDGRVHLSTTLASQPAAGATLRVNLYDAGSVVIGTLQATIGRDRTLPGFGGVDCSGECTGRDGSPLDLSVLAAGFVDGLAGHTLTLDLAGVDALDVAYADLAITETTACLSRVCDGDTTTIVTRAELDVDEAEEVWEGTLDLDAEGVVDVRVTAYDDAGATIDTLTTELVTPWDDGGYGVSALPTDEDPLTSVALHSWNAVDGTCQEQSDGRCGALAVASDGWYADDPLPTYAEVTLANGEQWEVPVNSYQVAGLARLAAVEDFRQRCEVATEGGVYFHALAGGETGADGTVVLSVTAYGEDAAALPASDTVELTCTTVSGATTTERAAVTYDPEVAVVFANTVALAEDPHGQELSGRVRLRGRQTLLVGRFAGQFGVDADGELGLAAIDRGEVAPRGDILIGGEPIDIEREVGGEVVPTAPPVIVRKNGSGTRNVATVNTGSPGLL